MYVPPMAHSQKGAKATFLRYALLKIAVSDPAENLSQYVKQSIPYILGYLD